MAHDGLIMAGYGTSRDEAYRRDLAPLDRALEEAFRAVAPAGAPCVRAYTSAKARARLERRGVSVPDVGGALEALWRAGVRRVTVSSTHLVDGRAYAALREAVRSAAPLFDEVRLAAPLIAGGADAAALARAIDAHVSARPHAAVVLVGHGAAGAGELAYLALGYALHGLGRRDVHLGLLSGEPSCDAVLDALGAQPAACRTVTLVPLMLAAAGHIERDIAGAGPASWERRLEAAGFAVEVRAEGLGAWPEAHGLAVRHLREAAPVLAPEPPRTSPVDGCGRFPLFVSLAGEPCLVVGGGAVGRRRAEALARFGAYVTLVDPRGAAGVPDRVRVVERAYEPGDETGCRLVVAATGRRAVNRLVGERCRRLGIPVSVADAPDECTFFFPALCEDDELVVGITSRAATPEAHAAVARAAARIRTTMHPWEHGDRH